MDITLDYQVGCVETVFMTRLRCKWEIELFFDVLKNGRKVEELQLSAIDRLELALALFTVVA